MNVELTHTLHANAATDHLVLFLHTSISKGSRSKGYCSSLLRKSRYMEEYNSQKAQNGGLETRVEVKSHNRYSQEKGDNERVHTR